MNTLSILKKAAPYFLISIILLGVILPNGIRATFANNLWSIGFVRAALTESLLPQQLSTSPESYPHAKLLQARVAMKNKVIQAALQLIDPLEPTTDPVLLETYAELLFFTERYPEALQIWRQLGSYGSIEHAARILVNNNNLDMANLAWQKAYEIRPDIYERILISYTLIAANDQSAAGNLSDAAARFTAIIEQFPEEVSAYSGLAGVYFQQGHSELAVSTLDQAMKIPSSNDRFYMSAGKLYEQNGNTEKAILAYQKVLHLSSDNPDALQAIERLTNPN